MPPTASLTASSHTRPTTLSSTLFTNLAIRSPLSQSTPPHPCPLAALSPRTPPARPTALLVLAPRGAIPTASNKPAYSSSSCSRNAPASGAAPRSAANTRNPVLHRHMCGGGGRTPPTAVTVLTAPTAHCAPCPHAPCELPSSLEPKPPEPIPPSPSACGHESARRDTAGADGDSRLSSGSVFLQVCVSWSWAGTAGWKMAS